MKSRHGQGHGVKAHAGKRIGPVHGTVPRINIQSDVRALFVPKKILLCPLFIEKCNVV